MSEFFDMLGSVMTLTGAAFVVVGGIGAIRMPDLYSRMHATSLTDTLGGGLVLGGLMLQFGLSLVTLKLAAVAGFLILTAPVASYALAHAAFVTEGKTVGDDERPAEEQQAP